MEQRSFRIQSGFSTNALYWITSLKDEEMGVTNRILEDLQPYILSQNLLFRSVHVRSKLELNNLLKEIIWLAHDGVKPIIHFDMHGSASNGLHIVGEGDYYPWNELYDDLQSVNIQCGNNLLIVAGVCYAMHMMLALKYDMPCSNYAIIAPEKKVTFGFLEKNTVKFYEHLFKSMDLIEAYNRHLSGQMRMMHCEKIFAQLIAGYVIKYTMGKKAIERKENLLSEIINVSRENTPSFLRKARATIKEHIKPKQDLVDKYSGIYLIGKECGFTMDDILRTLGYYDNRPQRL